MLKATAIAIGIATAGGLLFHFTNHQFDLPSYFVGGLIVLAAAFVQKRR